MKKILIADDHAVIRMGLVSLIKKNYPDCICHEAENTDGCVLLAKENAYDLIMLDINMPSSDTLGFVEWLLCRTPDVNIIILSVNPSALYAVQYYKKGVKGYLSKGTSNDNILYAVNMVMNNRIYMSQEFQETVSDFLLHKKMVPSFGQLSQRELSVAQALIQGKSYKEMADTLNISTSTVRTFKTRIFKKLGVKNTFEFLKLANDNFHIFSDKNDNEV